MFKQKTLIEIYNWVLILLKIWNNIIFITHSSLHLIYSLTSERYLWSFNAWIEKKLYAFLFESSNLKDDIPSLGCATAQSCKVKKKPYPTFSIKKIFSF